MESIIAIPAAVVQYRLKKGPNGGASGAGGLKLLFYRDQLNTIPKVWPGSSA